MEDRGRHRDSSYERCSPLEGLFGASYRDEQRRRSHRESYTLRMRHRTQGMHDHPFNSRHVHCHPSQSEDWEDNAASSAALLPSPVDSSPVDSSPGPVPLQPEPAPRSQAHRWIYLPEEDVYVLGHHWSPEISDAVRRQQMSRTPIRDYHSARQLIPEVLPRSNNSSAPDEARPRYRSTASPRPDIILFSRDSAVTANAILRSRASLIDWIMEGYDDGQRSRDILHNLVKMLTGEL